MDAILFGMSKYILLFFGVLLAKSGFNFGILQKEYTEEREETFELIKSILNLNVDIRTFYKYNFLLGLVSIIISYLSIQYGRFH